MEDILKETPEDTLEDTSGGGHLILPTGILPM
jgi:hypothetical protein